MVETRTWIDHIVLAVPDVDVAVRQIAIDWGVEPTPGGSHDGLGTRNALVALGGQTYLEVIGPDPDQAEPDEPRPFAVDDRPSEGALAAWAVGTDNIDSLADELRSAGLDVGAVFAMSRTRPDGVRLDWRLTTRGELATPFFIDWGATTSPAGTSASGVSLKSLRVTGPDAGAVAVLSDMTHLAITAEVGPESALEVVLTTPNGDVEIRS